MLATARDLILTYRLPWNGIAKCLSNRFRAQYGQCGHMGPHGAKRSLACQENAESVPPLTVAFPSPVLQAESANRSNPILLHIYLSATGKI